MIAARSLIQLRESLQQIENDPGYHGDGASKQQWKRDACKVVAECWAELSFIQNAAIPRFDVIVDSLNDENGLQHDLKDFQLEDFLTWLAKGYCQRKSTCLLPVPEDSESERLAISGLCTTLLVKVGRLEKEKVS